MVMWIRTSTISQSLLRLSAAVNKGYDFGQMEENSGQLGVVYKLIRGGGDSIQDPICNMLSKTTRIYSFFVCMMGPDCLSPP